MATTALLAVTVDPVVRARMERVAAAAQLPLDVEAGIDQVGQWLRAPMVLLDAALSETIAAAALPRRDHVVVFAADTMTSAQWRASMRLGAARAVTADEPDYELVQLLTDAAGDVPADALGPVIAVVGACGGVGASCLAAAIALTAARAETRVLLCDLDPLGAGLQVLLGMESVPGARWGDISAAQGRIHRGALRQALPLIPGGRGHAMLLGFGDRPGRGGSVGVGAVEAVLGAAARDGDTAVVDVPRALTAAAERVVTRAALTALVVPADVRGCYAAARLIPSLSDLGATLGLVVRGPSPGGVGPSDIADALRLPVVASMRPQPGLARSVDAGGGLAGRPRGPLAGAARSVLDAVGGWT